MKILKLIAIIILMGCFGSFAQTPLTPATAPAPATIKQETGEAKSMAPGMQMSGQQVTTKMNRYMVQIPHKKKECQKIQTAMKASGPMAMRFDWGYASGDHIGFAMLPGANEDAVRRMLPEGIQKTAKITKVDKMNNAHMGQMQK